MEEMNKLSRYMNALFSVQHIKAVNRAPRNHTSYSLLNMHPPHALLNATQGV